MIYRYLKVLCRNSRYGPWGIIFMSIGAGVVGLVLFAFVAIATPMLVVSALSVDADTQAIGEAIQLVRQIWIFYLPLAAIVGLLAVFGGYLLHREREMGRRICQVVCILAMVWTAAYSAAVMQNMPLIIDKMGPWGSPDSDLSESMKEPLGIAGLVVLCLLVSSTSIFLLWKTRRPVGLACKGQPE